MYCILTSSKIIVICLKLEQLYYQFVFIIIVWFIIQWIWWQWWAIKCNFYCHHFCVLLRIEQVFGIAFGRIHNAYVQFSDCLFFSSSLALSRSLSLPCVTFCCGKFVIHIQTAFDNHGKCNNVTKMKAEHFLYTFTPSHLCRTVLYVRSNRW